MIVANESETRNGKSMDAIYPFKFLFPDYRHIALIVYFGNIAWCIQAYNHSNRLAQLDKHDIAAKGRFLQFLFLLCLTG